MIDLSTCILGQKVEYRNGTMGIYIGLNRNTIYSHITKPAIYKYIAHKQDGHYSNAVEHSFDVVKIYPRETPEEPSMIDLSTCVLGQKVEYRNGKTGEYLVLNINPVYSYTTRPFIPIPNTDTYITHKKNGHHTDFPDGHGYDVVKIYPLETQMTDKSTESQVVRSKIDVFTYTDPNDKEKTERVEVTVDDLGVWITSCTGNVREEMNIDNKDLAIALAKAILEGYSEK